MWSIDLTVEARTVANWKGSSIQSQDGDNVLFVVELWLLWKKISYNEDLWGMTVTGRTVLGWMTVDSLLLS